VNTANIVAFLQTAYTDEQLSALFAHAQDRKLSYRSCCCFIGAANAPHALRGYMPEYALGMSVPADSFHMVKMRLSSDLAMLAERDFFSLGDTDQERCERLTPLIEDEIARRASLNSTDTDFVNLETAEVA
jgi:hypothetical protein